MSSAQEKYDSLLFELGDLARDRLAKLPSRPRTLDRVLKSEGMLVQRRREVAALEARMNEADDLFRQHVEDLEAERSTLAPVIAKWQKLVNAADAKAKDARKRLGRKRLELRQLRADVDALEKRQEQLDRVGSDAAVAVREKLKTLRIAALRAQRDVEETEQELDQLLTPEPGAPGERAIRAHRRLLTMEDDLTARKAEKDELLARLDADVAQKEEEVRAAEDLLERALMDLGAEVYASRVSDPALTPLYLRLDKVR